MPVQKPIKITETVLRDAHQSLIATRMPTELMLPIVDKMDKVGYHSVECWGGATFDACLRFLKEDPWDRLRKLRDGFKNTKLQMLFRGQNILGYRPRRCWRPRPSPPRPGCCRRRCRGRWSTGSRGRRRGG